MARYIQGLFLLIVLLFSTICHAQISTNDELFKSLREQMKAAGYSEAAADSVITVTIIMQEYPDASQKYDQKWFRTLPESAQQKLISYGLEYNSPQDISKGKKVVTETSAYEKDEMLVDEEDEEDEGYPEPIIKGYVFHYMGDDAEEWKNTECLIYDAAIHSGVLTEILRESPEQVLKHLKDFKEPKIYLCSAVYNNLSEELKAQLRTLGYYQSYKRPFIPIYEGNEITLLMGYTYLGENDKYMLSNGFNKMTSLLTDIKGRYPNMTLRIPRVLFEALPIEYQKAFEAAGYNGSMLELI